jgi:outer membrane protein
MRLSGIQIGLRNSVSAAVVLFAVAANGPAQAQSLQSALSSAYNANPELNAVRANVRGVDNEVASALSAGRPRVTGSADIGASHLDSRTPGSGARHTELFPSGVGLTVNQTLYNGGRTGNAVGAAESRVQGSRETLRNQEQNTLLDGVTAYMNVLRDTALFQLRENNVNVLSEQVRQTKDRFAVGEVTRTDVALSEARLAGARSEVALAQANLRGSIARFKQVIALDPKKLTPVQPVAKARLPKTQGEAVNRALKDHPAIAAALHGVDQQLLNVKVVEGELLPTVSLEGRLARRYDTNTREDRRTSASVVGAVQIPLYDGGSAYARTRLAKETLGERRLNVDAARDRVVAAVVTSWAQLEASSFQIEGAEAQVQASTIALNGVREEARVGQRTVLDVLNFQQELLNARVQLVIAQRDRVVHSYSLLAATGQLSARSLGLKVATYDPKVNYGQVRDQWFGLRTPAGE